MWCFDGEFVVECVVEMERKQRTFWRLKMRHDFELYFWVSVGERFRDASSELGSRDISGSLPLQSIPEGSASETGVAVVQAGPGCLRKMNIFGWICVHFDFATIRFFGGHPLVCGWRSYYQQGLNGRKGKDHYGDLLCWNRVFDDGGSSSSCRQVERDSQRRLS